MHPITMYDAAVREHQRAVVERARGHEATIRRRDRATQRADVARTVRTAPARAVSTARSTDPTPAQGAAPGISAQRPTADVRSAAGLLLAA